MATRVSWQICGCTSDEDFDDYHGRRQDRTGRCSKSTSLTHIYSKSIDPDLTPRIDECSMATWQQTLAQFVSDNTRNLREIADMRRNPRLTQDHRIRLNNLVAGMAEHERLCRAAIEQLAYDLRRYGKATPMDVLEERRRGTRNSGNRR